MQSIIFPPFLTALCQLAMPTLPGSLVTVWAAVLSVLFSPGYYERLYGTEGTTTTLNIVAHTPNGKRVSVSGRRGGEGVNGRPLLLQRQQWGPAGDGSTGWSWGYPAPPIPHEAEGVWIPPGVTAEQCGHVLRLYAASQDVGFGGRKGVQRSVSKDARGHNLCLRKYDHVLAATHLAQWFFRRTMGCHWTSDICSGWLTLTTPSMTYFHWRRWTSWTAEAGYCQGEGQSCDGGQRAVKADDWGGLVIFASIEHGVLVLDKL